MNKKKIFCLAEMALQHDMKTDLKGGGERVLDDFVSLLKKNGYDIRLYQFSYEPQTTKFRNHKIIGLGNIKTQAGRNIGHKEGLEEFYRIAKEENADGVYLLSMNLSSIKTDIPTITVSHGIMFNHCEKRTGGNAYALEAMDALKRWARNADHMISCDTDTMHLMSVYAPENINKMTYIPNYVDLDKFFPRERKEDGKFRILYPRRLQHARGYHILMGASDILLDKYENIEIIFAGQGNQAETEDLHKWIETKDDRVKHVIYQPQEMPKAYKNIDVGLVPTCFSEGTSLSCLELLASKVLPISTWVGGLSDLVQPNVNGLIIKPNDVNSLVNAIEYAMNNKEHVQEMRKNGQNMIKHFSKTRWEKDIMEVVKRVYG